MKRLALLLPSILLVGCVSAPEPEWQPRPTYDYPPVRTTQVYVPEAMPIIEKPNNWTVERKILNENEYVVSRSMEEDEYMWLTCKIEPTGITGLSLGIVQPDDIGYRNDPATLIFMVNGREVIYGPGMMVTQSRAALRSFDPRGNKFAHDADRLEQVQDWVQDDARIAQHEVIDQMRRGDHVFAEIKTLGIRREVRVDLGGFNEAADQVLDACDRSDELS